MHSQVFSPLNVSIYQSMLYTIEYIPLGFVINTDEYNTFDRLAALVHIKKENTVSKEFDLFTIDGVCD